MSLLPYLGEAILDDLDLRNRDPPNLNEVSADSSLATLIASETAFIAAGFYGFRESVNCPFEKAPLQVFEPEYVPVIVLPFI